MARVGIVGAGQVGATLAARIVEHDLADVAMVDVAPGLAKGKAMDIEDALGIIGVDRQLTGSEQYEVLRGSDLVVVTAGLARKPGMSREDLQEKNAAIIQDAATQVKTLCPQAILIIVTNPLDVMAYLAWRVTGFPAHRVMGMAGVLDQGRWAVQLAKQLKSSRRDVTGLVLGSHGDSMVIVPRAAAATGAPTHSVDPARLNEAMAKTRDRGAEIVASLKTGSAFVAPAAAIEVMVGAILYDRHQLVTASVLLNGEYGKRGLFLGVPVILGRRGVEKIIEVELTTEEREAFLRSCAVVMGNVQELKLQP